MTTKTDNFPIPYCVVIIIVVVIIIIIIIIIIIDVLIAVESHILTY